MKAFGMLFKDKLKHIDPILFSCTVLLSLISIVTIWGAVDNFGRIKLVMQIAMTVAGMIALFFVANTDYRFFVDRFAIIMYLVYVFVGDNLAMWKHGREYGDRKPKLDTYSYRKYSGSAVRSC